MRIKYPTGYIPCVSEIPYGVKCMVCDEPRTDVYIISGNNYAGWYYVNSKLHYFCLSCFPTRYDLEKYLTAHNSMNEL